MTKGAADVDAWMARYDNPQKALVQKVREVVLAADPRIDECIRWQAPTFIYKGNIASFFPRAKAHVSLMFHKGGTIPGDFPNLVGDGAEGRSFKISGQDDLEAKSDELGRIVRAWCDKQDGAG
jgi:uncharacterized protein YdhG (YjbR/CyaY superfamily)